MLSGKFFNLKKHACRQVCDPGNLDLQIAI
jgi:hypothetical protein